MNETAPDADTRADEVAPADDATIGDDDATIGDAKRPAPDAADSDRLDPPSAPRPPRPDGWPLVGNTFQFLRDPYGYYETLAREGDVAGYSIAGNEFVTLLRPEYVKRVLENDVAEFRKPDLLRRSGGSFIEEGLFLQDGEEWRRNRTAMQPTFYRERIEAYGESMARIAEGRADSWRDGEVLDLTEELSAFTLDVLTKTLFDVEMDERAEVIHDATLAVQERADASSLTAFLPNWVPTPANRRFDRATAAFDDLVGELIAERRASTSDEAGDPPGEDLLSLLLAVSFEDGSGLSDRKLRDHLVTMLFAGHETSSLALSYAILLLSQHPEKADRLREEVETVAGDGRLGAADVRHLDYTDRVLTETLRRYPPAAVLFREPVEPTTVGGYRVAPGTTLTLPAFRIHNDPRWYDDPDAFRPERWTDEMEADLPEYAYFPFGGGPRHCIGMRFATLEMKLALATFVRRWAFDLRSDPDPDFVAAGTMRPEEPVRVRVRSRTE
ncbi:cytochrome P450 [Halobium salinum]|uniref:Cytochrome P450 n=1 Tax=Halobium salinum TaxID=1364940 RepID=A0ABD5PFT5_9EURY|nr:cytochrome P450 [Halobium salinum]